MVKPFAALTVPTTLTQRGLPNQAAML